MWSSFVPTKRGTVLEMHLYFVLWGINRFARFGVGYSCDVSNWKLKWNGIKWLSVAPVGI